MVENEAKQPHEAICGAKTRSGTPCKKQAGWGTDHLGTGKCRLHGGASTGAPKKNKNSEKHGLYSKYFPKETMELFNSFDDKSAIEIMWDNIKIQFAAIIRSQRLSEKTMDIWSPIIPNSFLEAQSRAMGTLTKMIGQYEDMCRSEGATEEQKARIEELKARTKKLKLETSETNFDSEAIKEFVKATTPGNKEIEELYNGEEDGQI